MISKGQNSVWSPSGTNLDSMKADIYLKGRPLRGVEQIRVVVSECERSVAVHIYCIIMKATIFTLIKTLTKKSIYQKDENLSKTYMRLLIASRNKDNTQIGKCKITATLQHGKLKTPSRVKGVSYNIGNI